MDSDTTDQDVPNQVLPIGILKEGAIPQVAFITPLELN